MARLASRPGGILVAAPSFDSRTGEAGRLVQVEYAADGDATGNEFPLGNRLPQGKTGLSMSGRGDFDGDGVEEIALGSPYAAVAGYSRAGAVSIIRFGRSPESSEVWTIQGETGRAQFGAALDAVGDVNGDGFGDLVVGAPGGSMQLEQEGMAFLFLGTPEGLSVRSAWRVGGGKTGLRFGETVQAAGDVNGDRFADVLIAAPRWGEALPGHGEVRLYLGCREGLETEPAWVQRGDQPYSKAGGGLDGGFDINRDGWSDVLVGLPGTIATNRSAVRGEVRLFFGGPPGLAADPDVIWQSRTPYDGFGASVCVVGDMNGDGFAELAVGAPFARFTTKEQGMLRVFAGKAGGFSDTPMVEIAGGLPAARYGFVLTALGDTDGDGLADLGVGSPYFPTRNVKNGRCDVLFGCRGLGLRPLSLEALRVPAFQPRGAEPALVTMMAARRPSSAAFLPRSPAWSPGTWILFGVVALLIGSLTTAWRRARGKAQAIRHRLHDFVGSELSGLGDGDPSLRRVVDELRATVWAVKQERTTAIALVGRLADWGWEYSSRRGLALTLDLPDEPVGRVGVGEDVAVAAQAVVRVALSNVVEHARATVALLRIRVDRAHLLIEVEDNGLGMPSEHLDSLRLEQRGSHGWITLRRRVEELSGSFQLTGSSDTGKGTRLSVKLPIRGAAGGWWRLIPRRILSRSRHREVPRLDVIDMGSPSPISVAVFEDDRATCHRLRDLLQTSPGFRCVLAALSLDHAVQRVQEADPDVIILDILFPSGSGLAVLAEIRKARPEQRVLIYTAVDSGSDVLLAYLVGASGYVLKGEGRSGILAAVEVVADGGAVFSPSISWIFRQMTLGTHPTGWILKLTRAEIEVLHLLSQGRTAKEIAVQRHTAVGTINKQCEAIRRKAEISSMRQLLTRMGPWSQVLRAFSDLWKGMHLGGRRTHEKAPRAKGDTEQAGRAKRG